jgi:hypothetical protein
MASYNPTSFTEASYENYSFIFRIEAGEILGKRDPMEPPLFQHLFYREYSEAIIIQKVWNCVPSEV